jgi:hypothetical protein
MERNTDFELYNFTVKGGANAQVSGDREPTGGNSSYPLTRKLDVGADLLSAFPLPWLELTRSRRDTSRVYPSSHLVSPSQLRGKPQPMDSNRAC